LWQKAEIKGYCRANKFRKAAVSATRDWEETVDQENNDLANLMGMQNRWQIAIKDAASNNEKSTH